MEIANIILIFMFHSYHRTHHYETNYVKFNLAQIVLEIKRAFLVNNLARIMNSISEYLLKPSSSSSLKKKNFLKNIKFYLIFLLIYIKVLY